MKYKSMETRGPHSNPDLEEILSKAQKGDAFFVNRAAINGDLASLPDMLQKRIVAIANDEAARYASEQIIPLTYDAQKVNDEFIQKHEDLACRAFFSEEAKGVQEIVSDFLKSRLGK